MIGKIFKVNEYLSLKLEGRKTFIYVNKKQFTHCKYVLLNIPVDSLNEYYEINSIDEILDKQDQSLEEYSIMITPEAEFWAHCSNLQLWAEYGYNSDLLDSILAFPLLKKLTQEVDPQAKRIFKEEIAKRLERGEPRIVRYLIDEGYLKFLTEEERTIIFSSESCNLFIKIFNIFKNGDVDQFSEIFSIYSSIGQ